MKKEKLARLEKAGWQAGSVQDFLGLSDTEMAVVEVRVKLAKELRRRRTAKKISQTTFAARIGSSIARSEDGGWRSVRFARPAHAVPDQVGVDRYGDRGAHSRPLSRRKIDI